MYHKRIFLFASIVAIFFVVGISYASFSDRLLVESSISTGFIEPVFTGASIEGEYENQEIELIQSDKKLEVKVPFGFYEGFSLRFNIENQGSLPISLDENCNFADKLNDKKLNIDPEDIKEDIELQLIFPEDQDYDDQYTMVFKPSVGNGSWEKELNIIVSQLPAPEILEVVEVMEIGENQMPLGAPIQGSGTPEGAISDEIAESEEVQEAEEVKPEDTKQEEPDQVEQEKLENKDPKSEGQQKTEHEEKEKDEEKEEAGDKQKTEEKEKVNSEEKTENKSEEEPKDEPKDEDKSEDKKDGVE